MRTILAAKLLRQSHLPSPLVPHPEPERRLEVPAWVQILPCPLPTHHMATITIINRAASPNGRRFSASTPSSRRRSIKKKVPAAIATPFPPAASQTAKTSGAIRRLYLGSGKMALRCWADRSLTTLLCMRHPG